MTQIWNRTAIGLARAVNTGELSAAAVVESILQRIHQKRDALGAFLHVADEAALAAARRIDEKRDRGEPMGPLAGVPVALKDALCTTDAPTTCASRILLRDRNGTPEDGWRAPYDATVVERLRQADAIVIGKTNMDEFAMGSSTENSAFGPARNPWDPTRIPGGSSGGSAVSVAARMTPVALGSDTGGSIRQPAALCGSVGVKPSYGRVSRYGLVAFASSLDQVGPFARDVRDAARVLQCIAGHDPRDATTVDLPVGDYEGACERDVAGLTLGVPKQYFGDGVDGEVRSAVEAALSQLEGLGCKLREVDMPHTRYGIASYYLVATAEASSNLARFDGVRFGLRVEPPNGDLASMYAATRGAGFGAEVKRRIMLGTYALSAGYYDAYYGKAQRVRTLIRGDFKRAFSAVDALVAPVTPTPAFPLGERLDDPLQMYAADIFTLPSSLAGVCALSVPCGLTRATPSRPCLPVGLQIVGPAFGEETIFRIAAAWERLSPVRSMHPPETAS